MKSSGIGGQAVLDGVMMRYKEKIAVAVRKPDGSIEVGTQVSYTPSQKHKFFRLPIIRGIVSFIYSLVIGIKTLSYSADFDLEEEEQNISAKANTDVTQVKETKMEEKETSKGEVALLSVSMVLGLIIALVLFLFLPYWISDLIVRFTGLDSPTLLAIIEGVLKLAIFIGYIAAISLMKDIKRTFMYHGAEHKCINCIETGHELTVDNVMAASRQHRRCGTSFIIYVLVLSIIFFIFIRFDKTWLRVLVRLLLIPIIAGVSYEFIQWAGNSDSKAAAILSKPGLWVQGLTTREPDREMAEVGIASVEAVFDWRGYLREQGYEVSDPAPKAEEEEASENAAEVSEESNEGSVSENEEQASGSEAGPETEGAVSEKKEKDEGVQSPVPEDLEEKAEAAV